MAQLSKKETQADPVEVQRLKVQVEKDFKDLKAHTAYIKAAGLESPELKKQYDAWIKKNPSVAEIPYAYGEALTNHEYPEAREYLLKTVAINPKQAKVYQMLAFDAERWGDFDKGREYLKKASETDPASPDYAFYYASSLKEKDSALHHKLMLSIPERFPGTERGAQALYWLAFRTEDPKVKTEVYELARKKYNPAKSGWTSGTMSGYYDFLLPDQPGKALELASALVNAKDTMQDAAAWKKREEIAKVIVEGRRLQASQKNQQAFDLLNTVAPLRWTSTGAVLLLEKSKANAGAGNYRAAYDSLLYAYAMEPTDELKGNMRKYANRLGKKEKDIDRDVWERRKTSAKPATVFSLNNYMSAGKTTLSDLKGKVVLVTYWFPGCGPCRGEFPHFENVVRKFSKTQLAYVGINVAPEQDAYVVPFMKQSGYSFVPVKDEPEKRGNLVSRGQPTNYLLDKEGNIVFANFRTDERNERTLELMIKELLDK